MNDVGCSVSFDTPDIYAYLYNSRSELTNATAAVDSAYCYGYDFDDISNRESSSERGTNITYAANSLNQYTALNQTFEHSEHSEHSNISPVSMSFDRMGRRVTKNDQRFVYNGYLQVGNFHCSPSPSAFTSTFIWDPTEPVATRPLVWKRGTSVAYYTHDGNKNVSEVIAVDGSVAAHYEYAPFGALTVSRGTFAAANPFLFSSEYAEDDTATVYYNYRHYEPVIGRWLGRDPIGESSVPLLYGFSNKMNLDFLGMEELDLSYFADYSSFWKNRAMWANFNRAIGETGIFTSADDLSEKINSRVKECDCIRLLRVTAHGAAGYDDEFDVKMVQIQLGTGIGANLEEGYTLTSISDYFGAFSSKFCEKCTIRLLSCHLGENRVLADRLKKNTGCTVDLYKGTISTLFPPDEPSSPPKQHIIYAPSIIGGHYVH